MLRDKKELTLTVHHRSDAGRVRDHNEDYLGYRQPEEPEIRSQAGWLYAVADGVGGAQAGEVASKLAVQTLLNAYYHAYAESPAERLREAFAQANRTVHEQADPQDGNYRMSTTLVAAVIRDRELTVANVGDSRAYLVQEGQMRQITRDHAVVARLVAEGVITPQQAENHPQRHIINRSIGTRPEVQVDIFNEAFMPGDALLLCSDGLTEHLNDAEILTALQGDDPEASVQQLVDETNARGGSDNITVLLVRALRQPQERLPAPAPALAQETKAAPPARRRSGLWIGVLAACLLICAAGLVAGALMLLNPAPTPTPTPTATPLPPIVAPTSSATTAPTATPTPTETPPASDTPTAAPSATATETASPTATALPPTVAPTNSATTAPTATPPATPTATTEFSPLPTPTHTTEGSPLPTPTL